MKAAEPANSHASKLLKMRSYICLGWSKLDINSYRFHETCGQVVGTLELMLHSILT